MHDFCYALYQEKHFHRASRASVLITWEIRRRHVLLIILRWTQFWCADAINAKYVLTVKEDGFAKKCLSFLSRGSPRVGEGIFSHSYTRHASPLCVCFSRSTRTSARIHSIRGWRPRCTHDLHVRGCDFGSCSVCDEL